jgi:hypothetical protein
MSRSCGLLGHGAGFFFRLLLPATPRSGTETLTPLSSLKPCGSRQPNSDTRSRASPSIAKLIASADSVGFARSNALRNRVKVQFQLWYRGRGAIWTYDLVCSGYGSPSQIREQLNRGLPDKMVFGKYPHRSSCCQTKILRSLSSARRANRRERSLDCYHTTCRFSGTLNCVCKFVGIPVNHFCPNISKSIADWTANRKSG